MLTENGSSRATREEFETALGVFDLQGGRAPQREWAHTPTITPAQKNKVSDWLDKFKYHQEFFFFLLFIAQTFSLCTFTSALSWGRKCMQ